MRRLVHLLLLVFIVIGVRACGGATETQDRLGFASRWMAQNTGLAGAGEAWDTSVRPRVEAMTKSISDATHQGLLPAIARAGAAAHEMAVGIAGDVSNAAQGLWNAIRSVVTPNQSPQPASKPG